MFFILNVLYLCFIKLNQMAKKDWLIFKVEGNIHTLTDDNEKTIRSILLECYQPFTVVQVLDYQTGVFTAPKCGILKHISLFFTVNFTYCSVFHFHQKTNGVRGRIYAALFDNCQNFFLGCGGFDSVK